MSMQCVFLKHILSLRSCLKVRIQRSQSQKNIKSYRNTKWVQSSGLFLLPCIRKFSTVNTKEIYTHRCGSNLSRDIVYFHTKISCELSGRYNSDSYRYICRQHNALSTSFRATLIVRDPSFWVLCIRFAFESHYAQYATYVLF